MQYLRLLFMGTALGVSLSGSVDLTWAGQLERVSVRIQNEQIVEGDRGSFSPVLSANGRIVAFDSDANNLTPNDTNLQKVADVFVYNRKTKKMELVSVRADGTKGGDQESFAPALSADGQVVVFESLATNLVDSPDTNNVRDIFVRDLKQGKTTRVSVDSSGQEGNGASFAPAISADGCSVAFASFASNLVEGDTNGFMDIFVHDCETGETTRVSVNSSGGESNGASFAPAISADGRFVAFESTASNLISLDANGKIDTNGASDIFVHDREMGQTTLVSVGSTGDPGDAGSFAPSISGDGCLVAFESFAGNLNPVANPDTNQVRDVFLYNCQSGTSSRISISTTYQEGNGPSFASALAARGNFVAFVSFANNLDEKVSDTNRVADVFRHNIKTGETLRISVNAKGAQGNRGSFAPALSANGRFMAFDSDANNLVDEDKDGFFDDDTNGVADVFVK